MPNIKGNETRESPKVSLASIAPKRKRNWSRTRLKYSKTRKKLIAIQARELSATGINMTQVALKLNIPKRTLERIIASDELTAELKKKQKTVLDAMAVRLAKKSFAEATKRLKSPDKIKFKDLVVAGAIAHDKAYPIPTQMSQFNIGDKSVDINWIGWEKPHNDKKE